MAKLVQVHSKRAEVYLQAKAPDSRLDYTEIYKELRSRRSTPELPRLEGDVERAVKDIESAYNRLKAY
jgi:hypothetical protein